MRARFSFSRLAVGAIAAAALTLPPTATAAPDGRIAFQAYVGRFPQLFTIAPDGSGLRKITQVPANDPDKDPGAENPAWSPDGATIAFDTSTRFTSTTYTGVNLFTVAPDGSALKELPLNVGRFNGDPAYSPDGTQLSFDQDIGSKRPKVHGIFIANADGTNARRLTTAPRTVDAFDTESRWSPDGTRIAFTRVKTPGKAAVFVIGIDGTGLQRLTPWKLDAISPAWSPDGTKIVFNSHDEFGPDQSANLFWIRPQGGSRHALTHHRGGHVSSYSPAWSPDGARIVFSRVTLNANSARGDLYTMEPDGTGINRLTHLPHKFPSNANWGTAP